METKKKKKNTCKLCFRSFSSGRALGGHMRSHVAPTAKIHNSSSSSTSSPDDDGIAIGYGLRENPKRSFRFADPDAGSSAVVQDLNSESDTESSRVRSVSDTEEKYVAISLMMLSRDAWNEAPLMKNHQIVKRDKYQCGTCRKVFRSYQALGGHRASHKKFKTCVPPPVSDTEIGAEHACPVCSRSFASGQALGGHMRSHFSASKFPIDLNMPAPMEEEDADQMSAVFDDELN